MSEYPGDPKFAAERDHVRDAARVLDLLEMPSDSLACALLVRLWQEYDAAGMSYGRSAEARLLEAAQGVLGLPYPPGKPSEWPTTEALILEAKRRAGLRPRLVREADGTP